jgi:phasin
MPAEMRAFAEQSFEQARSAFEKFIGAAQSTMSTLEGQSKAAQASAKDVSSKAMAFVEQNMSATFQYAHKLVQARDPQTVMQLHADFVRAQMQALTDQAKSLGEAASKATMESMRPKS